MSQDEDDHDPDPVDAPGSLFITLCRTCGEKLRRYGDGWEHFGIGQPYESMTIGGRLDPLAHRIDQALRDVSSGELNRRYHPDTVREWARYIAEQVAPLIR